MKLLLHWLMLALAVLWSTGRLTAEQAVWQWSVPAGESRAWLWIPENCRKVRAVMLAQHNMIERPILESPRMRQTLADLNMAAVFIFPSIDPVFRFDQGTDERFEGILQALAKESGYDELTSCPVAPLGHSAHASFPWNFAAWHADRTLAVFSIKGDAPLTDLTGSGKPNPDWGSRTLDGVPGLMVMSEQEWWDKRIEPLSRYRKDHPKTPLALFCDTGRGHFDATGPLIEFLALFLRKAAAARLPGGETPAPLHAIGPKHGWLVDRWRGDEEPMTAAAPYKEYKGDRTQASWCFDEEMAREIEVRHASSRGKRIQQVGFQQNGALVPISNNHAGTELRFVPNDDGITFHLDAGFIVPLPPNSPTATKDKRPPMVTVQPEPAPADAHAPGHADVSVIVGPVERIAPGTFRVTPDWMSPGMHKQPVDAWFLACHPGNDVFKGAIRQARMPVGGITEGLEQRIHFPPLPDSAEMMAPYQLRAKSDRGLPVGYFVREGPACIRNGTLHLTPLPPRAKLPVKVTVVAWQLGRELEPKIRAATPVEQSLMIQRPDGSRGR